MVFNPWKHCRLAACVVLFLGQYLNNVALVLVGFILLMTGLVGGVDLTERRVELLEKLLLEDKNEKASTPKNN